MVDLSGIEPLASSLRRRGADLQGHTQPDADERKDEDKWRRFLDLWKGSDSSSSKLIPLCRAPSEEEG
jgi:hypothetical protein